MKFCLVLLAAAALSGCCYGSRTYVQPIGPFQAMTVHTSAYSAVPQQPDIGPRVNVTRRYMGMRPAWYETGYYLPEPSIVRTSNGSLYIEEYVWGFPPP